VRVIPSCQRTEGTALIDTPALRQCPESSTVGSANATSLAAALAHVVANVWRERQ